MREKILPNYLTKKRNDLPDKIRDLLHKFNEFWSIDLSLAFSSFSVVYQDSIIREGLLEILLIDERDLPRFMTHLIAYCASLEVLMFLAPALVGIMPLEISFNIIRYDVPSQEISKESILVETANGALKFFEIMPWFDIFDALEAIAETHTTENIRSLITHLKNISKSLITHLEIYVKLLRKSIEHNIKHLEDKLQQLHNLIEHLKYATEE